jgi:nitrite reductase/ring-hydroxylating ferredoxin subunit
VRLEDQAQFHPLRYLLALAERVDGDGSAVFERSRVEEVEDGQPCRLRVQGGTLEAGAVVHATHTPINLVLSIHTRIIPSMTYLLAFRSNQPVPDALFWDTAEPYHYLRRLEDERGPILLVGGLDHQSGDEPDTSSRFRALLEYALERFSVMEVVGAWSYEILDPVDGLPFIGRRPGAEHVYLATGFSGTGLTYGTLAGELLSDLILGRPNPSEDLFSPGRVRPLAGAKDFLKENLHVAWRLLADRIRRGEVEKLPVHPGEGAIVEVDGRKAAVYRDEEMQIHVLSPVCTHAGCIVAWNRSEKSWDCPCYGARYSPTGQVICGPATKDLASAPPRTPTPPKQRVSGEI